MLQPEAENCLSLFYAHYLEEEAIHLLDCNDPADMLLLLMVACNCGKE